MSRYLVTARYNSDGAKGLLALGGTARRTAVEKSVAELGGRLESFDFAFGDTDAYVIVDLPDNRCAALALSVGAEWTRRDLNHSADHPGRDRPRQRAEGAYSPPGK